MPGSLALLFNIDLSGGNANNFLVQNVTRALVDRLHVKFGGTTLHDTVGYGIYKIFDDLFLSQEERDNRILEGIQSEKLCKIRSGAGDKETTGVDAEEKLNEVYGSKYRIRLDHQILTDHGVFYPQVVTFKKDTDTRKNIKIDAQKRSPIALLLLFIEPYTDGARDSEKYIFPDLTKVSVTINGSPNMIYNNGVEGKDM